ncbi:helix-turn-helix domain-containing protein [Streptomyces olivoreticuli]
MTFTWFDTADLPPEQRFEWWCQQVNSGPAPTRQSSEQSDNFSGHFSALSLGSVQVNSLSFPSVQSERSPEMIRRSDPETYELTLVLGGSMWVSQARNEARVTRDHFLLWSSSRPYRGHAVSTLADGQSSAIILQLPSDLLRLPHQRLDQLVAHGLSADDGMGAILSSHLKSTMRQAPSLQDRESERLAAPTLDLAVSFLASRLGMMASLPPESRSGSLLARIDALIDDNLSDPSLSPASIATRLSISVRLLHKLFRQRGQTVAATIKQRRLQCAYADVVNPHLRGIPVHMIASRWGFSSAASFSRSFRVAYGMTAMDLRHAPISDVPLFNTTD